MILYYLFAAAFALAVCMTSGRVGRLLGVIDAPDGIRKTHDDDTPLVGGIAAIVPFVAVAVHLAMSSGFAPLYLAVAGVAGGSLVLGYIDDRGHISPLWRLALSVALSLAILVAVPALRVEFFMFSVASVPVLLQEWSVLFTVLCLVGLQNAVNMADGRNGLVIGLSLVWITCISAYAPPHLTPLLVALAVGLAIAMPFNWKGRLFLGDSGAYALSIAIGVLAIYVYSVGFTRLPADVVALWFLVPVVDCLRLMVMRVLAGRSPFHSDRNHFHHILNDLMPWGWALSAYLLLVAVPAALAFYFPAKTLLWALSTLSCYAVVMLIGVRGLGQRRLSAF